MKYMRSAPPPSENPNRWVPPSRWVHVFTGLATLVLLLGAIWVWKDLTKDAATTFGTVGLFLTAYGVLFSVIEVLRTQSVAREVGKAADRAANLARSPYDMRDASECATTIEAALHALQRDSFPRSQPLSRIIRLYTTIFSEKYSDDRSVERIRVGIVQSHIGVKQRGKRDNKLENTLAEMLSDIGAKSGRITFEVNET